MAGRSTTSAPSLLADEVDSCALRVDRAAPSPRRRWRTAERNALPPHRRREAPRRAPATRLAAGLLLKVAPTRCSPGASPALASAGASSKNREGTTEYEETDLAAGRAARADPRAKWCRSAFSIPASGRPSRSTAAAARIVKRRAGRHGGHRDVQRPPVGKRHAEDRARAQARRDINSDGLGSRDRRDAHSWLADDGRRRGHHRGRWRCRDREVDLMARGVPLCANQPVSRVRPDD